MIFRQDINGLRAIAVISVVLFHFNSNWLPGGFLGVDIFFVISGFLMTKIIFQGISSNSFSFVEFYLSRANRILPAITVLCACIIIFGWFYLSSSEYRSLGKHTASSLGMVSNIIYWLETGYFTAASKEKWLLHTWSLSVEWQFYLFYPAILIFLKRIISINHVKVSLLIFTIIAYLGCIFLTNAFPNASFYLFPVRVWEFLIGGLAFLYPLSFDKEYQKRIVEVIGVSLIGISYLFIDDKSVWPGYLAIIPVLGTFFIIQASVNKSILTNNFIFQKIGLWSYSIYLWHWPIVVYMYDIGFTLERALLGMIASFFIGAASYYLIEKKRSQEKAFNTFKALVFFKPHLYLLFFAGVGVLLYLSGGVNVSFRTAANTDSSRYIDTYKDDNYFRNVIAEVYREECNYYDEQSAKAKIEIASECTDLTQQGGIFIWGDSHAQALSHGLHHIASKGLPMHQVASSGCRPMVVEDTYSNGEFKISCDRSRIKAIDSIIKLNPNVVIMAQAKDHGQTDFIKIVNYFRTKGVSSKFVLVGPVPQWKPSLPKAIAKRHLYDAERYISDSTLITDLIDLDSSLAKTYHATEIKYISLINELCKGFRCLAKVDENNTPLHFDYGHLTPEGSVYVAEQILQNQLKEHLFSKVD